MQKTSKNHGFWKILRVFYSNTSKNTVKYLYFIEVLTGTAIAMASKQKIGFLPPKTPLKSTKNSSILLCRPETVAGLKNIKKGSKNTVFGVILTKNGSKSSKKGCRGPKLGFLRSKMTSKLKINQMTKGGYREI